MVADIVAILTDPETARTCLAVAAAAALPQAQVEAFHVRQTPQSLITPEEIMPAPRRQELEAMLEERSRALQEIVREWNTTGKDQRIEWREVVGDSVDECIASRGKAADLIVLARPDDLDGKSALHAAIFETRHLLLLAPIHGRTSDISIGRHMAVAWKHSPQADRAILAAIPWLKRAERVSILTVDEKNASASGRALAQLADHGVEGTVVMLKAGPDAVGECLLKEAHGIGADSIVMGAYRHARVLEMIIGGVTRYMINDGDLPVFMIH
jgi:nucleotide-binding universal stress UspA family protein